MEAWIVDEDTHVMGNDMLLYDTDSYYVFIFRPYLNPQKWYPASHYGLFPGYFP